MNTSFTKIAVTLLACVAFAACTPSRQSIFVDPQGNDQAAGTKSEPVQTIQRAIQLAQQDTMPTDIVLRGGKYELTEGIQLKGAKNLTIGAYKDEKVALVGGKQLPIDALKPITNEQIVKRLKPETKAQARYVDLNEFGIKLTGIEPRGFGRGVPQSWTELFINDQAPLLAQWPNDHEVQIEAVYGDPHATNAVVGYAEKLPGEWALTEGVWMRGYLGPGWADDMIPIASIDNEKQIITTATRTFYGFSTSKRINRYCLRNVLEEMDQPNEFVIDEANNTLYIMLPQEEITNVTVSTLTDDMIALDSCANVTIKGITMECTRGKAVTMEHSNHCVIDGCTLRNIGHLAVRIGSGKDSQYNGIRNSRIYAAGSGGVELSGGERKSLTHGNCFVENCIISDVNRIEKSYRPPVMFGQAGNRVSHVEIFDAPSMAILFHGNDQLIEYTDIHDVCKEINDQGAIYYGRNPSERGSKIEYSYIHNIHNLVYDCEVRGVYHDDGACGVDGFGCVFNSVGHGTGAVMIGGGSDINYHNCIFMNLEYPFVLDDRLANFHAGSVEDTYPPRLNDMNFKEPPFSEAYPELVNYFDEKPERPKRLNIDNNVYYNILEYRLDMIHDSRDYLKYWGEHNWWAKENPGFVDPNDPTKGLDYTTILENVPDFKPIPFDEIGAKL